MICGISSGFDNLSILIKIKELLFKKPLKCSEAFFCSIINNCSLIFVIPKAHSALVQCHCPQQLLLQEYTIIWTNQEFKLI